MMKNRRRYTAVFALCLIVALGTVFALPDQAHAAGKPARVTSLRVTSTDYDAVYLKWGGQKGIKKYQVYRSTSKNGKYKLIKTSTGIRYKDPNVQTGVRYWYKVRAVKGLRRGSFSAVVNGVPKLKTPTFSASSRPGGAKLTAGKVRGAKAYVFYRNGSVIKIQTGTVYMDKGAPSMKPAIYKVAAYRVVKGKKFYSSPSKQLPASKITAKVTLSGCKLPSTINSNADFKKTGTIKSNYNFKKVEIGIVRDGTWVRKYQHSKLNTRSFNINNADSKFNFKDLVGGTYKYRIYVHFEDGIVHTALNHPFTVKEVYSPGAAKGAAGAVSWAKKIANDNSFAYGVGAASHSAGCYFCGTNRGKKEYRVKRQGGSWSAKWEKTYCCNPFVFAAYAHGARNARMLKACSGGACGGMEPSDWTRYGCFKTLGTTKSVAFSSLKAGDVIISDGNPYNHVWMYCGGSQYVEAGSEGWGSGTIAVKNNASGYYNLYKKNGCYVMRYIGN